MTINETYAADDSKANTVDSTSQEGEQVAMSSDQFDISRLRHCKLPDK